MDDPSEKKSVLVQKVASLEIMADQAMSCTQEHFKKVHHEIEVQRLHIESEKANINIQREELETLQKKLTEERKVSEEERNNPMSESVQNYIKQQIELGIEEEIERQAYFEEGLRSTERNSQIKKDE